MLLIATTGWAQAEDRRRTAEAGFDLHLVKPFEPSVVLELISQWSGQRTTPEARSDR
jgi:CheY-like chemotaxis protein